jgi:hypothetical protein
LGVNFDFIPKPFVPNTILEAVRKAVGYHAEQSR